MKNLFKLIPAAILACSLTAQADVSIVIEQVGADVVVRGSGSLITENMFCPPREGEIIPTSISAKDMGMGFEMNLQPLVLTFGQPGNGSMVCVVFDAERTGSGIASAPGDFFGNNAGHHFGVADIQGSSGTEVSGLMLLLSSDYSSGDDLTFSAVLEGKTLDELGLIEGGGYRWDWSTELPENQLKAAAPQFLSIIVRGVSAPTTATPVPALGIFGLMGLASAIGAAGVAMNRRRKQ